MRITTLTFSICLLWASALAAQPAPPPVAVSPIYSEEPDIYLQRHSSTLEEGMQRGYGDVIRSYGMANLLNSDAAKNLEQARRDYIENRLKATQAYFEMRSYNDSYRRNQRSAPLSMEQYVRLARQQAPDRLSVSQLDPFTGTINWPLALRRPEYAEHRESIERLFASRASGTALVYGQIPKAVEEFALVLKADIDTFKQPEYIEAKNFLDSLAYESQLVQR
jgi:hypothetical protein